MTTLKSIEDILRQLRDEDIHPRDLTTLELTISWDRLDYIFNTDDFRTEILAASIEQKRANLIELGFDINELKTLWKSLDYERLRRMETTEPMQCSIKEVHP